eukprot:6222200-Amphidinium_carterae.1
MDGNLAIKLAKSSATATLRCVPLAGAKENDTVAATICNEHIQDGNETVYDCPKIRVTHDSIEDSIMAPNVTGQIRVTARVSEAPNVHDVDRQAGVQCPCVCMAQGLTDHRAGMRRGIVAMTMGAVLEVVHHVSVETVQTFKVVDPHRDQSECRSRHR